jgi:hypothetical protein
LNQPDQAISSVARDLAAPPLGAGAEALTFAISAISKTPMSDSDIIASKL